MKRILSLLLFAVMLIGIPGCKNNGANDAGILYHTGLSFSELSDSGTNAALEIARAKELLFRIERGELAGARAQAALDARYAALSALRTDAAIAYVRYCADVTHEANKEKYDGLVIDIETLACILVDVALRLSEDPALKDRYDEKTIDALLREDLFSDPAALPLFERERTLVGAYEALPETLTVEQYGRTWTGDEILSDRSLTGEEFDTLYEAYQSVFNAEAGAIFLDLIRVRREIARQLRFDSYADYRYALFGRSYTPEDAAQLSEQVRKAFVPLLSGMREDFYAAAGRLYGAVFLQEPTMESIKTTIVSILPELSEPWQYMILHGMYDLGTDPKRMPGSFTTYFAAYGAPFLFSSWTGGFEMIPTVVHEFGHYAAFYLNGGRESPTDALDLAEIDAQGLELLTVLRYDTIYGELCEAAETAELFYALYALIDGCAEDAFQQFAYAQKEPTLDALNAEYERLCTEYGLDAFGSEGRSWTQIPHTFQSPFYYISYTTSTIAALELYLTGKTDPDTAKQAYRSILTRHDGACFGSVLNDAGLGDPFDAEELKETARELECMQQH